MTSSTKIAVLGNSGVGKSSLVAAICGKPSVSLPSTVGACVMMTWHEWRAGSTEQRSELIELWDIGGATAHQRASHVFLENVSGVILVHDLANSKSMEGAGEWLSLVDGERRVPSSRPLSADLEACPVPVLLVGCKLDLAPNRAPTGYDRINVDCRREIPAGSSACMVLARFFDQSIDRHRAPPSERRRRVMME